MTTLSRSSAETSQSDSKRSSTKMVAEDDTASRYLGRATQLAQYDKIAESYKASKELPYRLHLELNTIRQLTGDLDGKRVLDIACGEGIYTRQLKAMGARRATGVDLSPRMIELAKTQEQREPQGISYIVADAANLGIIGEHDLVLASYLLNYAKTTDKLSAFLTNIRQNLKPGGYLVGVNNNPFNDHQDYPCYRRYGFNKSREHQRPVQEGDTITYRFFDDDNDNEIFFDNFYLKPDTYEKAFKEAGFSTFEWIPLILSKSGKAQFEENFWELFIDNPPIIAFKATADGK